jgi:hypothetical protein
MFVHSASRFYGHHLARVHLRQSRQDAAYLSLTEPPPRATSHKVFFFFLFLSSKIWFLDFAAFPKGSSFWSTD